MTTKFGIENPLITYKKSAAASQRGKEVCRHYKICQLAMFKELIGVYRENSEKKK